MMSRVVVTGMGLISCLGNHLERVTEALRAGRSGLSRFDEGLEMGSRSPMAGVPDLSDQPAIDRKLRRFMGDTTIYAYHAARNALDDAKLSEAALVNPRTGLIVGSGTGSLNEYVIAIAKLRSGGVTKIPPYMVPRVMGNTVSASLSTAFGIQGVSYSITSACATAAHCIGHGYELIQSGRQDVVIVGGADEIHWTSSLVFDAMGVLSMNYSDVSASRPFDIGRDGFVIAGGAGVLVLESLAHARARKAKIYAEMVGYGASSDGTDMVMPDWNGAARAMRAARANDQRPIDYINAHATSTPVGDISELRAIQAVFGEEGIPWISSTKGMTGHPIGASGAHEAIYSILMLGSGFLAGCTNIDTLDPACGEMPILQKTQDQGVNTVMSNSFGFGGTNACLIFSQC